MIFLSEYTYNHSCATFKCAHLVIILYNIAL